MEVTLTLNWVDWLLIVLYFVAIIGIGLYLKRFADKKEDFFEAGRRNSSWVAGLAFVSANLGALEILGWTGGTIKYGMFVSHFYWIGAIPAMVFLGLYMMPFYYSSKIHSIPGYLLLRFDEKTRILNAFAFALMTVLMSGINLYLMALVFRTILGWNWDVSIWVSAAAVACYITLGGLLSAIFTEIIQFFLIWFGLFLVSILGVVDLGGVDQVFSGLNESMTALWSTAGSADANAMAVTWVGIVMGLGFVLSFGYWTTDFLLVQRAFTAKDLNAARMTPIKAAFFKMMLPFIVVVAGLVSYHLIQKGIFPAALKDTPDAALPLLIAHYYPPGLVGLGITALLAGFMAGQAGNVSAFNTVWTYDIYRPLFKKDATDAQLVWMGRVTTIIGIFISIATAYLAKSFPTIMDYIQAIFSWVNAPLFATMLLGMFWKRTTSTAAFWGLIAGMVTSFSIFLGFKLGVIGILVPALLRLFFVGLVAILVNEIYGDKRKALLACVLAGFWAFVSVPLTGSNNMAYYLTFAQEPSDMARNLWQAIWAWGVCFGLTVLISLVTKPKPDSELVGLVKSLTPKVNQEGVPLWHRPAFWGAVVLLCATALNIYFW